MTPPTRPDRRRFLMLGAAAAGAVLCPLPRSAEAEPLIPAVQWLLRDHRANEAGRIDPALFDWLADAAAKLGVEPRYQVISGFRSSHTNEMLRRTGGGGVARKSLHMQGRAIDVRLNGVDCSALRDVAMSAGRGGVGYYRRSAFVHLDTGAVRAWAG